MVLKSLKVIQSFHKMKKNRSKLLHQLAVLTGDSPNNIEDYARKNYTELAFSGVIPESVPSEIIMQRPDYLKAEKMLVNM